MKVTALGEFGLIATLARIVNRAAPELMVGIGDDAAVWAASPTADVATADILVEGVHFTLSTATWFDLGWKSIAVNLSDLAAMGARPRHALLSIALPVDTDVAQVEQLYEGAVAVADRFGLTIAGGDTVRSPGPVVVSVAAFGAASIVGGQVRLLRRSAAKPGDVVAVTGTLGGSAGGLEMLLRGADFPAGLIAGLREAHLRPMPRVPEAQLLLGDGVASAMDISDGLVGDLAKLCLASGVAAVIDPARLPLHPLLRQAFPARAVDLGLYGGEDYELLFSAPPDLFRAVGRHLRREGLAGATAIGEISAGSPGRVLLREATGELSEPRGTGYDAFPPSS